MQGGLCWKKKRPTSAKGEQIWGTRAPLRRGIRRPDGLHRGTGYNPCLHKLGHHASFCPCLHKPEAQRFSWPEGLPSSFPLAHPLQSQGCALPVTCTSVGTPKRGNGIFLHLSLTDYIQHRVSVITCNFLKTLRCCRQPRHLRRLCRMGRTQTWRTHTMEACR
jgi:hypothetical protein